MFSTVTVTENVMLKCSNTQMHIKQFYTLTDKPEAFYPSIKDRFHHHKDR